MLQLKKFLLIVLFTLICVIGGFVYGVIFLLAMIFNKIMKVGK